MTQMRVIDGLEPAVDGKGRIISMKQRQIVIIFLVLVLLIAFLIFAQISGKNEDLFKQLPQETLAKEQDMILSAEAAITAEPKLSSIKDKTNSADTKEATPEESELFLDGEQDSQKVSLASDREQQEAAMETMRPKESNSFNYIELNQEIKERINGKSYGENCTVPYEELRYVSVLYLGFDNQTHTGEMIVNKAIAEDVIAIFAELYEAKYPIERMVLVDEYEADDNTSMAANNSSAFNYRVIEGTNRISKHSCGLAIDINPLYNPYIHEVEGERVVTPVEGAQYEDRSLDCPYYIHEGDTCYQAFIKRGFTWGGDWKNNKDYQHFQKEPATD